MKDISQLGIDLEQMIKAEFTNQSKSLGENIKITMQKEIKAQVYDAYTPKIYPRTYDLFKDIAISDVQDNGENISFDVYDYANHGGKDYPYLVEHGQNNDKGIKYDFPTNPAFTSERPFMQSTVDETEKNVQVYIDKNIIKSAIDKLNNK